MNNPKLGKFGEEIASRFLKDKGYKILGRNYVKEISSLVKGEIDIIAKKDDTICFIEVKTTESALSGGFFNPEDRVNKAKLQKLSRLSQLWLSDHRIFNDSKCQIDVISIKLDKQAKKAKVKHFKNCV